MEPLFYEVSSGRCIAVSNRNLKYLYFTSILFRAHTPGTCRIINVINQEDHSGKVMLMKRWRIVILSIVSLLMAFGLFGYFQTGRWTWPLEQTSTQHSITVGQVITLARNGNGQRIYPTGLYNNSAAKIFTVLLHDGSRADVIVDPHIDLQQTMKSAGVKNVSDFFTRQ